MQSFNKKPLIDLPNIRKKQTYKNEETNDFDLLFNNSKTRIFEGIKQKDGLLRGYHFYLAMGLTLLIGACFLVVQIVTNSPEIEKYKTVTKNIEDIENDVQTSVPDVQFANPSVNQVTKSNNTPKQVISKKIEVVVVQSLKKKPSSKIEVKTVRAIHVRAIHELPLHELPQQQAITDIMLRPLAVVSKQSSGLTLRASH